MHRKGHARREAVPRQTDVAAAPRLFRQGHDRVAEDIAAQAAVRAVPAVTWPVIRLAHIGRSRELHVVPDLRRRVHASARRMARGRSCR